MKKNIQLPAGMRNYWEKFSGRQQLFIVYFLLLVLGFIFLPLISIHYLDSTQIDTFTIFHKYMLKTAILISLILAFLAGYNFSGSFKHMLNNVFGITSPTPLMNIGGLIMMLIALFSIADTVTLLKQSFSSRIGTTSGFIIMGALIVFGIVWHLIITRMEHKRTKHTKEVTIKQQSDDSGYDPNFEKAKKEVEGLFGEETI